MASSSIDLLSVDVILMFLRLCTFYETVDQSLHIQVGREEEEVGHVYVV